MSNCDIDFDFFTFFQAFEKVENIKSELGNIIPLPSSILDDGIIKSDILQKYNNILTIPTGEDSLIKFIEDMEKFKEKLLKLEPNFEYYCNKISDNYGDNYSLEDNYITAQNLELIYPGFKELSPERKIIIYDAIKYANMSKNKAMKYATGNYTNNYNGSGRYQFAKYDEAWCANFCGGIISYRYGKGNILGNEYKSVWKIVGNYKGQTGIAFSEDENKKFIFSPSSQKILLPSDDTDIDKINILDKWTERINEYNNYKAADIMVIDWFDEKYVPLSGDLIVFNFNNGEENKVNYPNEPRGYSHIGFVLGVREKDGKYIVDTVEGNVSNSVDIRSYELDNPHIKAFCHIKYENYNMISETPEKVKLTKEEIQDIADMGIQYFQDNEVKLYDICD